MTKITLALAATTFLGMSGAAFAQATIFNTQDRAANAVEGVEESVRDDFSRDARFQGNSGRPLGWTGSVSGRAAATSGNTDTVDVGIGARFGHFDGLNGHNVTLSYSYGENTGVENSNSLLLGYDYTRELNNDLYFYGQLQTAFDQFSSYETDVFAGIGLGYRAINTSRTQWSIQGGPGWRYLEDNAGNSTDEVALSVGHSLTHRLTDTSNFTWDTDVLWSETDTLVTNEFGITVAMSDNLALRGSVLTEFNSDPLPGFDDTDTTLSMSIVYNFD